MSDPLSPTSTINDLEADASGSENEVTPEIIQRPAPSAPIAGGATNGSSAVAAGAAGAAGAAAVPSASANRHYLPPKRAGTFDNIGGGQRKRKRNGGLAAYPGWEKPPEPRRPYHEYVHSLVEGGWDMLRDLDAYLHTDLEDAALTISVLDVAPDARSTRPWPDLHDESDLAAFMEQQQRDRAPGSVRLYLAEQQGGLAAGVIEALGAGLDLDPRFFQWTLFGHRHVLSPSHRHHAPFVSVGFGVPRLETPNRTDAEKFKVTVYVQPDKVGDGWTGVLLFASHTKVKLSPYNLFAPPAFVAPRPAKVAPAERSFRELFLAVFPSLDLAAAGRSPFYAIHVLLRLNYVTWSEVINSIRSEDRRIHGISDTSVGHAEEIAKSLALVQRGGSLGWKGRGIPLCHEVREALEEDFKHLVQETEFLWSERDKMAAVRQRKSENRWTLLTNTFTYVFAPVSIMSGIYGMNVKEIVGDNPDIWQFFVAVIGLNVVVLLGLAVSNWIHVLETHKRKAGVKEVFGFALGRGKHLH